MDTLRTRLVRLVDGDGARERVAALTVAVVATVVTYVIATTVFAYHSSNHDEAVYLQQASMLLAGQLELYAGDLAGAFRPWFFIEDGGRLYPKYQPYPAVLYAAAIGLFGEPRVALAAVAGLNAALVYVLGAMTFERRIGVVAAAVYAASPLALVSSSVFLPYAPTTTLNLLFAVSYLRGIRREDSRYAAVAGIAIGLAFFARPYTAVLFAGPFILHALYDIGRALRTEGGWLSTAVRRNALTTAFGLAFVALTLAYNARMTGSPLVFSYEVFAPLDGPGFGYRRILGHDIDYTLPLALETNRYVLQYLLTRWFTAGPLGTLAAVLGAGLLFSRWVRHREAVAFDRAAVATLGGLLVSVPLGNLAFWGNFNILATMSEPTDGLISQFGPFYHFDLLVPLSLLAAVSIVAGWRLICKRLSAITTPRFGQGATRVAVAVLLVAGLLVGALAAGAVVSTPLERNAAYTEKYDVAYEPVESESFDEAVVFLPTPYGEWQNHPFQYLRNDPGFDGSVVYALERSPDEDFAVLDTYPDRTYYRYAYRGEWTPDANRHVVPKLEPLSVRDGERLDGETTVGVPDRVDRATVALAVDGERVEYDVTEPDDGLSVGWELTPDGARLSGTDQRLPVDDTETVVVTVRLTQADGGTLTYRQAATVRSDAGSVEAIWPPERTVCPLVTDCGTAGTYLSEQPEQHRPGVSFETRLTPAN